RRGRAELLLQDRRQGWGRTREDRLLPSLLEGGRILLWTRRPNRSAADQQMLSRALWVHGRSVTVGLGIVVAVVLLALALSPKPPSPERTPLEQFLDRTASTTSRLTAMPHLQWENEGEIARVLLELRDERDHKLVRQALEQMSVRLESSPDW